MSADLRRVRLSNHAVDGNTILLAAHSRSSVMRLLVSILTVLLAPGFLLTCSPAGLAGAPTPPAALFASNSVWRLRIEVATNDLERLRKDPRQDVPATLHDGLA